MRKFRDFKADPTAIGNIAKPPFARLPDPENLFTARAARFRHLAVGHDLGPYLSFLADLSDIQAEAQKDLPSPAMPDDTVLARASEHEMPPLDRNGFAPDESFDALFTRLTEKAAALEMPAEANAALVKLRAAGKEPRNAMIANILADAVPVETMAEHAFMAAVLQVHFARMASSLDAETLKPVGDGVCPTCGGAPSSSLVVGWANAEGTRFCSCSLCGTLWNYVRAKCTLCGSTKDISFREVDGSAGTVKAECCESCRGYVKVLYQSKDREFDPIADDVASLGLDLLVRELGFRRGSVNPFLIGY